MAYLKVFTAVSSKNPLVLKKQSQYDVSILSGTATNTETMSFDELSQFCQTNSISKMLITPEADEYLNQNVPDQV